MSWEQQKAEAREGKVSQSAVHEAMPGTLAAMAGVVGEWEEAAGDDTTNLYHRVGLLLEAAHHLLGVIEVITMTSPIPIEELRARRIERTLGGIQCPT